MRYEPLPLMSFDDGGALLFINITDGNEGAKGCCCQLSEYQENFGSDLEMSGSEFGTPV